MWMSHSILCSVQKESMHCQCAQLNAALKGSCIIALYKIEFCKKIFAFVLKTLEKKRKLHCSYRVRSLLADHGRNISSRGWTFLTADMSCKVTSCSMWRKKPKKCEAWELTQPYVYRELPPQFSTLLYTASALYHSSLPFSQDSRRGPVLKGSHNTLITMLAAGLVGSCFLVT